MTRVQLAWRHLNKALALGARSSESYRIRGLIAQYQLQYDRAVDELERGAAFAPSDAETQRRLAVVYAIKGRIDDALKAAAKAVADDPRNVDSYTIMGLIQLFHDENLRLLGESNEKEYTDALKSFEQGMLYAQDKSGYASSEYADLLEYAHQPERAAKILVDRAAQTQHYVDYYKLGRIYQTSGRPKPQWEAVFQRAKTILDATVVANPLDARAFSYLALTETRLGSYKNALEASSRARQLAPNDVDVLYNTARMFALQTDKAQALEYLGKAVDIRYRLSSILDMDFYNLRSEPEFQSAVTR
jgi:tetratricopeptide (TPR) repeat protein